MTKDTTRPTRGPTPDDDGFRDWMSLRAPALRRKAFLMCGDWHSADDLVQDTVITMYSRWPRIAAGSSVDAYASRVLVGKYVDQRRRPWRRERVGGTLPERADHRSADAFEAVEGAEALLTTALATLSSAQRAVLVLRFTDDLSVDEIAAVLGLPSGTVKSRLSRATATVRTYLSTHPSQPDDAVTTPAPSDRSTTTEDSS